MFINHYVQIFYAQNLFKTLALRIGVEYFKSHVCYLIFNAFFGADLFVMLMAMSFGFACIESK